MLMSTFAGFRASLLTYYRLHWHGSWEQGSTRSPRTSSGPSSSHPAHPIRWCSQHQVARSPLVRMRSCNDMTAFLALTRECKMTTRYVITGTSRLDGTVVPKLDCFANDMSLGTFEPSED